MTQKNQIKLITVVGARPQFIKAAALSRELKKHQDIKEIIIHTGQHFDLNMSDIFFEEMEIPRPDYKLEINSLNHGAMTGRMLEEIEKILVLEKPKWVLVYGDTNSTLAGALAAKKLHIPVVHVEAGLRSFNMNMPEEINRILTDRVSDVLCCPTNEAVKNLKNENIEHGNKNITVSNTGDVMQDAALFYSKLSTDRSNIIAKLNLVQQKFILCTVHRAENTDNNERLENIFDALLEISKDIPIVLPMHPRTQKILDNKSENFKRKIFSNYGNKSQLIIIKPIGYFDMIEILKSCNLVMTDSGGLQKEAFFFSKPCITMRDETEWVELIENGVNILAGADKGKIISATMKMLNTEINCAIDLYGEGKACSRIVKILKQ